MLKKIIQVCLALCALSFLPNISFAANDCRITSGETIDAVINISTLKPSSKGAATGAVLGQAEIPTKSINYTCGSGVSNTWRSEFTRPESAGRTAIDHVYATNLPGIGIRITWPASRSSYFPDAYVCNGSCMENSDKIRVEFVQTGNVSAGTIPAGMLGQVVVRANSNPGNSVNLLNVRLANPIDVKPVTCAVLTPSQEVDLGSWSLADFIAEGGRTDKVKFPITIDCPQSSQVAIGFDGNSDTNVGKGYIKNCSAPTCAQNIGVRLSEYGGSSVDVTGKVPSDTQKKTVSGRYTFEYEARIYSGSPSKATPGSINTFVVFNVFAD